MNYPLKHFPISFFAPAFWIGRFWFGGSQGGAPDPFCQEHFLWGIVYFSAILFLLLIIGFSFRTTAAIVRWEICIED